MKPRDDDLVVPLGDDCATALALRDLQLRGDLGHLQARSTTEKIRKNTRTSRTPPKKSKLKIPA